MFKLAGMHAPPRSKRLLRDAQNQSSARRVAVLGDLLETKQLIEHHVLECLLEVRAASSALRHKMRHMERVLDTQLIGLVLRYAAIMEAEKRGLARRVLDENVACDHALQQLDLTHRLNVFATHLEHETRGNIVMRRLVPTHPQFLRCKRAASENVKRGFFSETAKYSGVKVLDVYKIENRILLDSFQQTAATSEPGKVKGLFCSVPLECLERVVVYGLSAGAVEGTPLEHVFQESWINVEAGVPSQVPAPSEENDDDAAGGGHAQRCVDRASSIPFPRSFSRHSTLEEDRELCNAAATVDGTDSEIRFLALCRVMIGQIFVTSKVYQSFPDVNADAQFDSMYSSVQEEYRLLNPSYVLPEFLVQYRFAGRRTLASNGPDAPETAPAAPAAASNVASALAGLECSLLTPELQLPEYLTRDLKAAPHVTTQITASPLSAGWERTPAHSPGRRAAGGGASGADEEQPQHQDQPPSWDLAQHNALLQKQAVVSAIEQSFSGFWRELSAVTHDIESAPQDPGNAGSKG